MEQGSQYGGSEVPRTAVVNTNRHRSSPRHISLSVNDDDGVTFTERETDRLLTLESSDGSVSQEAKKNGYIAHCHQGKAKAVIDKKARTRLIVASVFCLIFMTAEIVGGLLAHSLAIVSDAAHLLTDFASFLIGLFALYLSARQPTKSLSFGWYRAEILGAFTSILLLWILTGILVYSGIERIIHDDYEINATIMLITASCGVVFNIIMGTSLHQHTHSHGGSSAPPPDPEVNDDIESVRSGNSDHLLSKSGKAYGAIEKSSAKHQHSHGNFNVKAAFIHVLGDLIQSVGVFIAALIIYFKPEWKIADPICTFFFSIIVLITTFTVFRDIVVILMEGTPKGINFDEVRAALLSIEQVKTIHDLRMWSLSLEKTALSVHLAIEPGGDQGQVLREATALLNTRFGIFETTVQTEEYVEDMSECSHCQDPC